MTDGLTEVFNHRYFYEHLEKEMERAERYNRPLSLIMMDIDYFKDYNDVCGHKRGDDVLKQMAKMLIETTRKFDVVARYGGDEFTIILPETDKTEALNIAERIRRDVEQYAFSFDDSPEKRYLTMSLGIATYPYDAGNVDELVDGADRALYKAKKRGRNRVCLFLNSPMV
ncbi:MAG: GGDEF domain-containing protein [Actinomycetota bacterium]